LTNNIIETHIGDETQGSYWKYVSVSVNMDLESPVIWVSMFSRYFFVFITIIDRVNILYNQKQYVLPVLLLTCDVYMYNIIVRPLNRFTIFLFVINRC